MAFPAHEIQLKWKKDVGRGGGIPQMLEKAHNSYFSAVFQCLCHTPPLTVFFFAREHSKDCEKNHRTCLMCSMEKLVCDLFEFGRRAVCPRFMINNMCEIENAFNLFEEQDIYLVLLFLLEGLHNSCLHGQK
uniref:USP domain-containing protein n=1 Tax=Eptatretus burgeri TaxID=7764 RepID=A0A8C4R7J8_EPTBU